MLLAPIIVASQEVSVAEAPVDCSFIFRHVSRCPFRHVFVEIDSLLPNGLHDTAIVRTIELVKKGPSILEAVSRYLFKDAKLFAWSIVWLYVGMTLQDAVELTRSGFW